jgi:hypothetical protein
MSYFREIVLDKAICFLVYFDISKHPLDPEACYDPLEGGRNRILLKPTGFQKKISVS